MPTLILAGEIIQEFYHEKDDSIPGDVGRSDSSGRRRELRSVWGSDLQGEVPELSWHRRDSKPGDGQSDGREAGERSGGEKFHRGEDDCRYDQRRRQDAGVQGQAHRRADQGLSRLLPHLRKVRTNRHNSKIQKGCAGSRKMVLAVILIAVSTAASCGRLDLHEKELTRLVLLGVYGPQITQGVSK